MSAPDWLPELIKFSDYAGDWKRYIEAVFAIFYRDFIESQPKFKNLWVRCRRDPMFDGKEAGFWHCISDGPDENNRIPDLRRCERIGWIRTIIENCCKINVRIWRLRKNSDNRVYLWLNQEYLVVLGDRVRYVQLITAFCTDKKHTIAKLEKEYREHQDSINS